jgi:hypothetical protein
MITLTFGASRRSYGVDSSVSGGVGAVMREDIVNSWEALGNIEALS